MTGARTGGREFPPKDICRNGCPEGISAVSGGFLSINQTNPTQNPMVTFAYLINICNGFSDLVPDSCMASETIAVARLSINLNLIGFERETEFSQTMQAHIAVRRAERKSL